tara:strand:- start:136 stop:4524 length:4389 start_codon:yes stop_codon:yes gene_type:complete
MSKPLDKLSKEDVRQQEKIELVKKYIQAKREKLLDISNRNNLVNLRFSLRSNRVIRIIDELPDIICQKLISGTKIKVISLPHPKDELEDEKSDDFLRSLEEEKTADEEYLNQTEKLGEEYDESDVKYLKILRSLKDKVREKLDMELRPHPEIMKIEDYARAHNLNPKYEVPAGSNKNLDKHNDNELQTLFYPQDFERKCRALNKEARRSIDERGTNTLHISFGCLEWEDSPGNSRYSPLCLMQTQIKEEKTSKGYEFYISSDQAEIITNISLKKKLEHDFGVKLPKLEEGETPEKYFEKIKNTVLINKPDWKIKRFITLAIHSYAKMSMYEELDPENWEGDIGAQENIMELVTGSDKASSTAEVYDVDDEKISAQVPILIDEADSSQFSAIYEAMSGRNLAIQGPPGTGKSTTIANMIASLMFAGKNVLFVAEKKAALDVVYKKLKDKGLSHFAFRLPSTAEKQTEILNKLKQRDDLEKPDVNADLPSIEKKYSKQKAKLRDYARILTTKYFSVEKTGAEILNTLTKLKYYQDKYPKKVNENPFVENIHKFTRNEINKDIGDVESLEKISTDIKSEFGSLKQHPWHGLTLSKNDPYQIVQLLDDANNLSTFTQKLIHELDEYRKLVNPSMSFCDKSIEDYVEPSTKFKNDFDEHERLLINSLTEEDFIKQFQEFYNHIDQITKFRISEKAVAQNVELDEDFTIPKLRRCIKDFEGSIFIISYLFNKKYRDSKNYFKYVAKNISFSKNNGISIFKNLIKYLKYKDVIQENIKAVREKYKKLKLVSSYFFKDDETDIIKLNKVKDHLDIGKDNVNLLIAINSKIYHLDEIQKKCRHVLNMYDQFKKCWKDLSDKISVEKFFGFKEQNKKFINITDKFENIDFKNKDLLSKFIQLNFYSQSATKEIEKIFNQFVEEDKDLSYLSYSYKFKIYNSLSRSLFDQEPNLSEHNASSLDEEVRILKDLDSKLFDYKKDELVDNLLKTPIDQGKRSGSPKDLTQRALLNHEWNKKRMFVPYRQLFKRAGRALRSMNPCYMLSPVSLSQIVEAKSEIFDVLIIDEASQMPIEEALGAILRSKQSIIVGDPMQLPPTNFFSAGTSEDDIEDDNESILDLALSRYQPMRMLRWHYRSKSESLINFSNYYFYDNKLIIPPSPNAEFAVKNNYVDKALYQARVKDNLAGEKKSKGGVNVLEASKISDGVINFMKECFKKKEMKSCLVVTMNNNQRDLIDEEIRLKSHKISEVDDYIAHFEASTEPFTVKNLENVQGDERDTIFISTLFGPDKDKNVRQRFGPIVNANGYRRLNVLFTRAKERIELYTSMRANDITEGGERGKQILKSYLEYAATQKLDTGIITSRDTDSDFEDWVKEELEKLGYQVYPQVGVGGFRIDLGIKHSKYPGYIAGIECDGAAYHSSVSARDNDIVRQKILEGLGWNIYRIWSTNWFKNPQAELVKLDGYLKSLIKNQT